MKKLEDMIRPISESAVELVRPDAETDENVEVEFCDDKLIVKYQEDVMIMTRDVLQNIILMVDEKDLDIKIADIERRKNEEKERMLDFIETAELQEINDWYDTDTVCEMLNDWGMISGTHQYGLSSYISTLFGNALIDLNDYDIRKKIYNRIG